MRRLVSRVLIWTAVAGGLALAAIFFYWPVTLGGGIFTDYDLLVYFYPYQAFLGDQIRRGSLPLWNPYLFAGVPFLANIQTAVFYPPNWIVALAPPPYATTLLTLGHVSLAALGMTALGRSLLGLSWWGALAAGVTFAFGGFLTQQAGHPNQLATAAWLPLLLLVFDRGRRPGQAAWLILGCLILAGLILAGHSQEAYYSLLAVGVYAAWRAVGEGRGASDERRASERRAGERRAGERRAGERRATSDERASDEWGSDQQVRREPVGNRPVGKRRVGRWRIGHRWTLGVLGGLWRLPWGETARPLLSFGLLAGGGLALAALQILPTLELSRRGIRAGGLSYEEAASFSLPPWEIHRSLLPFSAEKLPTSEFVGYVGLIGLALAIVAIARTRHPLRLYFAALVVIGLLLALGGYDPLYGLAYRLVPGVGLFRVPARWLFWVAFGLAALAGIGFDRVIADLAGSRDRRRRIQILVGALAVAGLLWIAAPDASVGLAWVGLTVGAALILIRPPSRVPLAVWPVLLLAVLAGELWLAGRPLAGKLVTHPQAWFSIRPAIAQMLIDPDVYRVLSVSDSTYELGDRFELADTYHTRLGDTGLRSLFVALKLREIFSPNLPLAYRRATLDGYDGGILPLGSYVAFKSALIEATRAGAGSTVAPPNLQPDGLLIRQLAGFPALDLLSALNVKYLIADKGRDPWIDGVYYDLGLTRRIAAGEEMVLPTDAAFPATGLGLVSYLEGAPAIPGGSVVGTVTLTDSAGRLVSRPLRVGQETAEGLRADDAGIAHPPARVASRWANTDRGFNYLSTFEIGTTDDGRWTVDRGPWTVDGGPWTVDGGAGTVDGGAGTVREIARITIRYEGPGELVVRGLSLIDARTGASRSLPLFPELTLVQSGDLKVYRNDAVLPRAYLSDPATGWRGSPADLGAFMADPGAADARRLGAVEVAHYAPGEARFTVEASEPAHLIFTETAYPGWQATVDGQPVGIEPANGIFQGVAVPAGRHEVAFRFVSQSFLTGVAISAAALSALLVLGVGLILAPGWRRRKSWAPAWFGPRRG